MKIEEREIESKKIEVILRKMGLLVERTGRVTLVVTPRPDCAKPEDNLQLRKHAR